MKNVLNNIQVTDLQQFTTEKLKISQFSDISPQDFNKMIQILRDYFIKNDYLETFPQPTLSILAACEDPKTVKSFKFNNQIYPLPQTNQMNLEEIIMKHDVDGVYCLTSSYRDEPNPVPGRHLRTFGMFEVEHKGDFKNLIKTLNEIVIHLGFVKHENDIPYFKYNDLCKHYNVDILTSEHETLMWKEFGDVVGIVDFPEKTSPFFNMSFSRIDEETGEKLYNKCDLIICGQETFGCAERSNDVKQMYDSFHTISDGEYSKLLFDKFEEERVEKELNEFLNLPMISRWGFGCGLSRLHRAMKIKNLI